MSTTCSYCGAPLKLKFCVVCGRHGTHNKMGSLRGTARNTDVTQRLDDPLYEGQPDPQKSLRFRRRLRPIIEAIVGGLIIGILIFCAAKQALDFYGSDNLDNVVNQWMKSHHFALPYKWSSPTTQTGGLHKVEQRQKQQQRSKNNRLKDK